MDVKQRGYLGFAGLNIQSSYFLIRLIVGKVQDAAKIVGRYLIGQEGFSKEGSVAIGAPHLHVGPG